VGAAAISGLGVADHGDDATVAGIATAALVVFLSFELERRRTQPGTGAAIIFQRLQQYGVPLILLFVLSARATYALNESVRTLASQWGIYNTCSETGHPVGAYCPFGPVPGRTLLADWLSTALVAALWAFYAALARRDTRSAIRQAVRLFGLFYTAAFAVDGLFLLIEAGLQHVAQVTQPAYPTYIEGPQIAFVAPLVFGVVVASVHALLLRDDAPESPLGRKNTASAQLAVLAFVAAISFWVGLGEVVHNLLDIVTQSSVNVGGAEWTTTLAAVIAGVPYVPLAVLLARRSHQLAEHGPRRGLALGLLASGVIASAIGAATLLYAVVTNVLGSPLDNWGEVARAGASMLVIGAVLAGIYGNISVREHYLRPTTRGGEAHEGTPPAAGPDAPPATIEQVLDDLLAQWLTRDEAAARLRELTRPSAG
jgi:hypothetical protein